MDTAQQQMSTKERDALREHLRGLVRVGKAEIDKRAAALRAEAERELSTVFKAEDELCREAVRMANETVVRLVQVRIDRH
jgi:hypothetical protein